MESAICPLSSANTELAALLDRDPRMREQRLDLDDGTIEFLRHHSPVSAWPIFVPRRIVDQAFQQISAQLPAIFYRALKARFGDDGAAFAAYFGWPRLVYDLLLRAPVDPAEIIARYDIVLRDDSCRVLEMNCS